MYAERESNSGNWTYLVPATACLDDLGGLLSLRSPRGPKPDFRNLLSLFSEVYPQISKRLGVALWILRDIFAIFSFSGHRVSVFLL